MLARISFVVALLALTALPGSTEEPEWPQLSFEELDLLLAGDSPPLLLDVRSVDEFEEGRIAGSLNIPHDELERRLTEIEGPPDRQVIVYCRSGRRAEVAAQILDDAGFERLALLDGHMLAWVEADRPVETDPEPGQED